MNEVNELFTKENVEKIYVPDIVKDDLLSIIEEKLKKAGFYYRVAYRVKAPDSMLDKLILKDYRRPGTENQDRPDRKFGRKVRPYRIRWKRILR